MMRTELRPFTEQDLDAAARLLAARHREDRQRTPALSERFGDPAAARPLIVADLARPLVSGIAALQGDELVGYLIGMVAPPSSSWSGAFMPRRTGEISYAGYAATGPEQKELYRRMYGVLAPFFVEHGAFTHGIEINAGDEAAIGAWFSLGFGQVSTLAARPTAPLDADAAAPSGRVEIKLVGAEEIETLLSLGDELDRHHNASPIFLPYLPEETSPGFREYQLQLLANPDNAHWVAYRDGTAIGMQTFHEQDFADLARPDRAVYLFVGVTVPSERGTGLGAALLRHAMDWARTEGYERCTLHFLSANIPASRFWLKSGFQPLTHRLVRQVDERIAWARVTPTS